MVTSVKRPGSEGSGVGAVSSSSSLGHALRMISERSWYRGGYSRGFASKTKMAERLIDV